MDCGRLYVVGDDRLSSIVGAHKDEFPENVILKPQDTISPALILPELPQPIYDMNGRTLCSILTGIGKDLNWKKDKREWWPDAVPFVHPHETPPQLKGTLCILHSYSFNLYRKMVIVSQNSIASHL